MSNFQTGSHWAAPDPAKRRTSPWVWVTAVVLVLIIVCSFLTIITALSPENPAPTVTITEKAAPGSTRSAPVSGRSTTPPAAPATIEDGLWHVGEDVDAGTYRLKNPVSEEDFCYWKKSRDAEGSDIIDNDFAGSGRLQVTLKKGQWFESDRCGSWVRK